MDERSVDLDPRRLDGLDALGQPGLVPRLLASFLEKAPQRMDRLRSLLAKGDCPGVVEEAHQLSGSASNLGAQRVAQLAREMELQASVKQVSECHAAFVELEAAMPRLCSIFAQKLP